MIGILIMFWEFFKTGLFAVGGGMATIPFLYDMAKRFPWFSQDIIPDMIAISESTPGPIGVNMATYAGYTAFGIFGGIVATLGPHSQLASVSHRVTTYLPLRWCLCFPVHHRLHPSLVLGEAH